MKRNFIKLILCVFGLLWMPHAFAESQTADDEDHWGIGLQGNLPLWGGLSAKYMGTGRVHIQAVEHYVQNGDEYSLMAGVQTPIILARYPWTRLYIAPGVGIRRQKEIDPYFVNRNFREPAQPYDPLRVERTVNETTLGGALLVGLEFFLDNIFTDGDNSRYGFNIEFGQGIGQVDRDAKLEDEDGNAINASDYPDLQFLEDDPEEKEGKSFRASFVVGVGFHIYF
jgi:hypothetical protein